MLQLIVLLLAFAPSQVCGAPNMSSLTIEADGCSKGTEHICTVDEWPDGWTAPVCCSPFSGCRFSPFEACYPGETPTCGIVPEPDPEPALCSPLGTLDAHVTYYSCEVAEVRVCTHGDTPTDPTVLVCCVDPNECRLEPGDGACEPGEWLACGHAG